MKRLCSVVVAMTLLISLVTVNASATTISKAPDAVAENGENVIVLNDPELLKMSEEVLEDVSEKASRFGLTLKNRTVVGQRYYADEPFLADNYQGPLATGPKFTISEKRTASFSGECGVTAEMITASFGVSFTDEVEVTREIQFDPVPAGKTLYYYLYINYTVYEFEVYSGNVFVGTSQYWTPVGIVVKQELR